MDYWFWIFFNNLIAKKQCGIDKTYLGGTVETIVASEVNFQPTLVGELIELRPLRPEDFEALYLAASDPEIWVQHPQSNRYQRDVFAKYFSGAMESKGALVVFQRANSQIIGCSRYYDFKPEAKQIIIGYTFLSQAFWGGKFNRELKTLMLNHAFHFVDSVLFEIGEQNIRSQKAIEKIGASRFKSATLDGKSHLVYKLEKHQWKP